MSSYKTIKECAVDIICKEGDKLSNKQIADKVRNIMNSGTNDRSIAWYKNKINRGLIKVDKNECKWLQKDKTKIIKEISVENLDEEIFENEAEKFVFDLERKRTGKFPKKMNSKSNDSPGYDIDSDDRHIEVKCAKRKNKTYLHLTANETESLIKDPRYFLYLVEGDFDKNPNDIDVYVIPKNDLLAMAQMKIHARLTQLSNKEKRKKWIY